MLATAAKFLFLVWHDRDLGGPARDGDLLAMIMNNSILPADSTTLIDFSRSKYNATCF